jgi:hypothetical protein
VTGLLEEPNKARCPKIAANPFKLLKNLSFLSVCGGYENRHFASMHRYFESLHRYFTKLHRDSREITVRIYAGKFFRHGLDLKLP